VGVYLIAGVLHPEEAKVLLSGIVYFIALPTTFILLNIYSFCNLHVMKWGTREDKKPTFSDEKGGSSRTEGTLGLEFEVWNLGKLNKIYKRKRKQMNQGELNFYNFIILKYMKPLIESDDKQKLINKGLITLRNNFCIMFFGVNVIWLTLTYAVGKLDGRQFYIGYPEAVTDYCAGSANDTANYLQNKYQGEHFNLTSYRKEKIDDCENSVINPLNLGFLSLYLIIIAIQFICMVKHRITSMITTLAVTPLYGSKDTIESRNDNVKRKSVPRRTQIRKKYGT